MLRMHKLTVDGQEYFLPHPVKKLRAAILAAIRAGGGYVRIPPRRTGSALDVLVSPGTSVSWSSFTVGPERPHLAAAQPNFDFD